MINQVGLKIIFSGRLLILILSLSAMTRVYSQNYSLKTFTTADGLTHNNIRQIISDKCGFLWISTWDGLNRFDGYEFRQYHHIPGDTTSLPFFSIANMATDGSDNIWLLTDNNKIVRYIREKDNFTTIESINGQRLPNINNIYTDDGGDLWIISFRYLFRYRHRDNRFERIEILFQNRQDSLFFGNAYTLKKENSRLWLAGFTTYELELNEEKGVALVRKQFPVKSDAQSPQRIIRNVDHVLWFSMFISEGGNKWLFSNTGLYRLDESTGIFNKVEDDIPVNEFTGKEVFCWGDSDGGMTIYRSSSKSLISIPPGKIELVKYIVSQGDDVIWFSSTSFMGNPAGLGRIILTPGYFKKYSPEGSADYLLAVYSVTKDREGNLWLGTRGKDHIIVITPDGGVIKKFTPASTLPTFYGPVRTILNTRGGLWIGYFYGMLLFYDYNSGSFIRHEPGVDYFRAVALNGEDKIYTGYTDLRIYDPLLRKSEIVFDTLLTDGLFRLTRDKNGILWGAMPSCRILRYDPTSKQGKVYKVIEAPYNIEDVCPVDSNEVWLALLGGGVVKFNPETNEKRIYTTASGLSNNTTYSILRDKTRNIWISTDNGISRLNPETGVIKKFGMAEGLDIVEFNSGASFIDEEGRFYFGGMGGAVSFFPDSINRLESDATDQRILLSRFTVSGRFKILPKPLNRMDTLVIDPGENNFRLAFSSTDFANSAKTIYRYMISEQDNDWQASDVNIHYVNYSNLRPGFYTLLIEATDRNGEWAASRKIIIHVRPLFHQRVIFKVAAVLLLFSLIHLIISLYLRQMRQKSRLIQDELRLQALRGQMNPHFIFNSLNSINYFISGNDKISANRYISDFSRLIRSILSNMGSDYVPLTTEISSIRDYLEIEHLRFGDKFDYEIITEVNVELEKSEIFPGLIQPFIENAIWHGIRALENRKGTIRVKIISKDNERMQCIVEDDGVGRKASAIIRKENSNHNSKGISIVRERLSIISKIKGKEYRLEISDLYPEKKETGTVVKIDIPLKTA